MLGQKSSVNIDNFDGNALDQKTCETVLYQLKDATEEGHRCKLLRGEPKLSLFLAC